MTIIKRIMMKGFKSFGHKTELQFSNTFNCVLGPNGSGKSNVMDSLCFVLGKGSAKGLRAEKSANLIYNGGKTKQPAKSGEVSLVFDNKDKTFPMEQEEVSIARMIKGDGSSVYKINDQRRTRAQVLELLGSANINPDGYNIILQGDIVHMIEMPSVERRKIVEDIAGISVYEEKKQKAVSELNKVEEKLGEAEIVLAERKTYLNDLRKDRDQAIKFKELQDKLHSYKATLVHIQIERRNEKKAKYDVQIKEFEDKIQELQEKIDADKKTVEEKKAEVKRISAEIEQKGEAKSVALLKEIEQLKVDIATNETKISSHKSEIERVIARKEQLVANKKEIEEKIKKIESEGKEENSEYAKTQAQIKQLQEKIAAIRKKHKMDDSDGLDTEIAELEKNIDVKQKEISELREKQQNYFREKDKLEFQLEGIDEKIKKVMSVKKEHQDEIKKLSAMKDEFKKTTLELNKIINNDSSYANQISHARQKLQEAQEQHAKLTARSVSIKESAAASRGTQVVLENGTQFGEVHGLVSDLGSVKGKYAMALEIAAAGKLQSIVVDHDKTAANAIKFLKQNKLGSATFLPLNKMRTVEISPEIRKLATSNGCHGLAIDLVSFNPKYKSAFSYVLGKTIVVDNVDVARRIGVGKVRMVTLDGDLVELSGAMHGGFRQKRKGLAFKEEEVEKDLTEVTQKIGDYESMLSRLEAERTDGEEKIQKLREFKANLEGDIIKTEKSLHLESGDLDASNKEKSVLKDALKDVDGKADRITDDISDKNRELTQLNIKRQEIRTKITQMRNPRLLAELTTYEQKITELREFAVKLDANRSNKEAQIKNILGPERDNITKILNQHTKEEETFSKEISSLKAKISEQKNDLAVKEKAQKEFYAKYKELFKKKDGLNEEIQKLETKIIGYEENARKYDQKINVISIDNASIKAQLAGLEEEMKRYEGAEILENKNEENLKKQVWNYEKSVTEMGSVNMKALEVYEMVEKEYNGLIEKQEKLKSEREEVLLMMNEIEAKKKEMFMQVYDVLNEEFVKMFKQLSTKGEAFLALEHPDSPFDGGMDIKVRLTGKKFMDIRSLSGGEKTMTALAFIFAIQEFQPASFYFLDEVDAALDKRNAEKLANLVKQYCDKAQYIVISHNDGVISAADTLFGVSMNEHGISKVVSLKV